MAKTGMSFLDIFFNMMAVVLVLAMIGVIGVLGFACYVMWGML